MKKYLCNFLIILFFISSPAHAMIESFVSLSKASKLSSGDFRTITINLCGDYHYCLDDLRFRWFLFAKDLVENKNFLGLSEIAEQDESEVKKALAHKSLDKYPILETVCCLNNFSGFDVRRGELSLLVDCFVELEEAVKSNAALALKYKNKNEFLKEIISRLKENNNKYEYKHNDIAPELIYMSELLFKKHFSKEGEVDIIRNDLRDKIKGLYHNFNSNRLSNNLSKMPIKNIIEECFAYYHEVLKKVRQMEDAEVKNKFTSFIKKLFFVLHGIKIELGLGEESKLKDGLTFKLLNLLLCDKSLLLNLRNYVVSGPSLEKSINDCFSLNGFLPSNNKSSDRRHIYLYFLIERLVEADFACRIIDRIAQGKNVVLFAGIAHTESLEELFKGMGFIVSEKECENTKLPSFLDKMLSR